MPDLERMSSQSVRQRPAVSGGLWWALAYIWTLRAATKLSTICALAGVKGGATWLTFHGALAWAEELLGAGRRAWPISSVWVGVGSPIRSAQSGVSAKELLEAAEPCFFANGEPGLGVIPD